MSQRVEEVVCCVCGVFPQDFRSLEVGCLCDTCLMLDVVSRTLKGLKYIYICYMCHKNMGDVTRVTKTCFTLDILQTVFEGVCCRIHILFNTSKTRVFLM